MKQKENKLDVAVEQKANEASTPIVTEKVENLTTAQRLKNTSDALETALLKVNAAISADDPKAYNAAVTEIQKLEEDYAAYKRVEVYDEIKKASNPVLEAVKIYRYEVTRYKPIFSKENKGKVLKGSLVASKRQIELLNLFKFLELDMEWNNNLSRLNQLLCLRAAKRLGCSQETIDNVLKNYSLNEKIRRGTVSEIPDSNNKITKLIQEVVDGILYIDDGNEKNTYKSNSHDSSYLIDCYVSRGTDPLSVRSANDGALRRLIMDILHRLVTDGAWGIDKKSNKGLK